MYNTAACMLQMVGLHYDSSEIIQVKLRCAAKWTTLKLNVGSQGTNPV